MEPTPVFYSEDQQRVLQHAADILNVSLTQLLGLPARPTPGSSALLSPPEVLLPLDANAQLPSPPAFPNDTLPSDHGVASPIPSQLQDPHQHVDSSLSPFFGPLPPPATTHADAPLAAKPAVPAVLYNPRTPGVTTLSPLPTPRASHAAKSGRPCLPAPSRDAASLRRPKHRPAGGIQPRARKERYRDPDERRETCLTRRIGACAECHKQKIRCLPDQHDPHGPCLSCIRKGEKSLLVLPCLRDKVTDAIFLDKGEHPQFIWSARWKSWDIQYLDQADTMMWASASDRTIALTQDIENAFFTLRVREFIPGEGDVLHRSWSTDGVERKHLCAPFAIADMREAADTYQYYMENHVITSINFYMEGTNTDPLVQETFRKAYIHSEHGVMNDERQLLKDVLLFWATIRQQSRSDWICGEEDLGMQPQDYDSKAPSYHRIIVPPAISAQMEFIATVTMLLPLQRKVCRQLNELMERQKHKSWFAIYLTTFILLHSCARLTAYQMFKAKKLGLKTQYVYPSIVETVHRGAEILLYHFHCCYKGNSPLASGWKRSGDLGRTGLNDDATTFLLWTSNQMKMKEEHISEIRQKRALDDDFYLISKLFDSEWTKT
ncbi:hypothetical protein B0T16DRAFT_458907 [Cercophora newfieldiana]|uniref:Zn(2)-C6 fungal-type domain-containing protein n=1 Tax=Cercophora newfieldiana TaxID=92897 RepID=A0AA39Y6V5_9PEZI|nr:hypothetical protein B0T16DRAFT_458907 [Cercophora newfieldiana]